jgi:hypothetical protein
MLPQHKSGSLAGGRARTESTTTAESNSSWRDTLSMDSFKASHREMQETLQALQRARAEDHVVLDRLCKHLMGPLDV